MRRAAAIGVSPNRITLLRDADGDGVAEQRHTCWTACSQPFGMALVGDTFYVGNTDGVVAFPYTPGATRITAPGRRLTKFRPAATGHAACWPAPTAAASMPAWARSATSATWGWTPKKAAPASTSWTCRRTSAAPSPAACATRWAWPGSPPPAAVDGGQRTRRPGRRDAARLPDRVHRRRLLRLALLLLGPTVDDRVPQDAAGWPTCGAP
jgi:hypothetical protein